MYPCHCCKSAHHDIALLSHWSPSESDEEIVNEAILSELGETSVHWLNELTETYLAEHCGHDHGSLSASPNVSKGWSPFPKGGIHYIPDSTGKQMTTGDMTPLTALLSSPRQSQNDLHLKASIQAITDPSIAKDFPSSQVDLNWTIGMATPVEKFLEKNYKKENPHELGLVGARKVTHRQLFSPTGSSACDDSFSLVEDDWSEGNLTVETEKTFTSEADVSCENEVTMCEQGPNVSWASAEGSDGSEKFIPCDQSFGGTGGLGRTSEEKAEESPRSADGCDLNFSNATENRCSSLFDDSFGSAWERTSDLDLSLVRSKSEEKSVQANVSTRRQSAVLERTGNHSSSMSHIEKVLAKVFDGDGGDDSDSIKDSVKDDAVRNDTQPAAHQASVEPDCAPNIYRKRQSAETTPHSKKQKLEHVPNNRTQNQCNTEYKMEICDQVSSLDCCPTLSVGQSHGIPEPLKKKGGVISILKNSMTPKNTCKKRVQFNLDIDLGVNMSAMKGCKADAKLMASADTAGFQLTSADNLCNLVSDPEPGQDAVSSTDLSEYFFKNAGGCRSTETSCHDSDNRGKCHPCNQTTQPVTAEVDLTDYNFDSSFEASPTFSSQGCPSKTMEKVKDPQNHVGNDTFSSQGCPSKTMEKVKDPQDHVGKDIVLHQVMAPKHIAKVETVVNDETGGGSYITSQGNDCLKISRKAVVSDRIAAFCNVDACVAAAELENQPEGNVGTGRGMGCLQSEFCDIEINCDNCNHSGGTHAAKSSPYKSAPTEQALETLSADVPSSAPKPLANRISHNVEMKPTLNLGSTRPRKFRYPTADQIARSNPDRHTSEDHGFKPTLNCTVLTKPFIQESTAAYHQRAHQGEPEKSQLNSSQIVSETELQKAGGKVLGFVTFSEVYKENPESNLQVKTTCPPSMFHGSLSTKPSAECSVKLSNDTVIAPTSSSTCILRTSHTLTASPTPKNGTNKDMPRLERKPCTASSADNENPSCIPIYHQPNSLSNRLSISVNDRLWASHDLGSITASTSQDQCPTNVNNSPKTCPTSILGSPVDDYTLPSQIWASTEFSQIEEGFDLEMSVSTEGQASLGSTPVQVSEKSADLSVTFSGNENQLQNYACNNETALTSLSTLVPTSSCSPNTKYIESTSNTDLGNCYSAVKHAEATLNINLEKNCDIKQAVDTPNINPGTCSSNRKQVEATSNINPGTCSSNRKQVEATSNINLEKTLHEVLGADDFTFCQPNPMKLTPACPTGFATASGRQLSHFAEAHANKCMDNLEDQLEFLLASKKEKVESEEGARPYAMKTDQQGKLKVKTSYPVGMFPGRDTSMGIGSRTLISVRNDNNFNSLPPVCKGSENLKFTEKHQDSEAFEVNNSMGKSFTSASERVFPSPLNSTANGLSKTNILPSNEELQLGSIMSVSFDFPQGGFSTAGGGQISLSEAARNKAKKIWDSVNQESNLKDPLIADESLTEDQVTTSANMNISEISLKAALGGVSVDERPKGFKPFKAPSLKSKNDSKHNSTSPLLGKGPDLQKRPSVELDEWGDDSILKDIITDEENLPPVHKTGEGEVIPKHFSGSPSSITSLATKAQPPLTSGFTTGSGKHVPLSKKAMQAAEKFWKEFEADAALPVPFELDTISSADLLTRHSEQANKPDRSTVDLNFKQPFESGAKLTNSCLLSSKIPKGSDISAVSKIMGPHEPLTKENSSSYSVPSKLSITGKRLWSPNEELNLNSEFSFENDVTDSNCAGTAKDTVAASHSSDIAEAASVIEYCAAVSHATLKVANDLNLLCQRDLTDTNLMCVAPGVSLSVTEIAHSPVKLDGFTSSAQDSSDKSAPKAIGFSNASGSKVTVSEKALRQAKTLFDESNDTTTTPSTPNTHELTAVNEALHKMKDRVPCNIDGGSSNKTLSFSGFTTASGTSVSVAEKAWLQARSFLEESSESEILQKDCNLLQPLTETLPVINSFTISTVDGMLLPDKTLKCGSNNCFTDPNGDSEACFNQNNLVNTFPVSCYTGGFSTASGKKVNVSKVALDRAKGVLKDTLSNSNTETPAIDTENNDAETYSRGFFTASDHKVNVSKVALDHAKGLLKDTLSNSNTETPAIDTENNDAKTYSHGFSTASGRKVNVSKVALDHAHGVLKDALLDTDTPARNTEKNIAKPHSSGFSTALGHKVNVSKVALDHAKGVLKDTLSNSNTETLAIDSAKTYSGGFSTASGRKVNVSKMALDHANGVLKDALLDSNAETPARDTEKNVAKAYSGSFSTALGHKVNVSKVALDHAHGVLKEASLEIESSTVAAHLSDDSALLHVKAAGLRYDLEAWPKSERTRYTSTPLTDRRSKSCSLAEGGQTDPLKRSFTPVSSRCEEFLYDRPVTRSGKRLYPVKPRSLTNELGSATLVENNLNSKSSFKPPCKKAKLSSDKDLEVCPAAASGPKTNHITKGSFVPPMFKPPSATHSTKPSLSASKVTNEDLPGDSGTKEPKTSAVSKNSSNIAKADLRTSVDMEDDAENLLLCQDFETRSPASAAISKGHESQSHSNGPRSRLVTGTREAQKGQGMLGASKSQERSHPLSELVLEEEKIKQGKIIRAKKRARVRPQCGRWMEARKKKGSLQKLNDLEPATGLTREELLSLGVSVSALEITGLNAREFRFDLRRFYPALDAAVLLGDGALLVPDKCGYAGVEEFYRAFQTLDSVDPGLVDDLWVGNHFRWIVWKLAAYEVSLPHHFAGRSLTPDTVMLQLKYRYDREIDACHRSALKKIIERDETPSKRMVLCVASVVNNSDGQCMVEVTDGWYSIKAQLDDRLADLVSRKKIAPGDKIVTSGAELVGGQDACSPLEIKEGMALKLHGNSTRPAPWHSRLGFCLPPSPLCVPIKSLCSDGGHLGCVDVVISRIYPVMYMEKLKGGGCVFRTAEEEDKARQRHESKREAELEKIYSGLQNESKENLKGKRRNLKKFSKKDVEKLWDGHEIAEALDIALNPDELQLLLSQSQLNRLMEHRQRETDRHQEEMKRRLAEAMSETQEVRNVAPVLKVKVSGLSAVDVDDSVSCLVTVWRPGPEWTSMEEGQRYKLYNMPVSTVRGRSGFGKVSLTATRQTRLKPCSVNDNLLDMVFEPREVWTVSDLTSRVPIGNEFDFLGVVIQMNTSTGLSQPMLLYASDKNGEFLCIKLWSGTQMNSLKCGQIFVACNLSLSSVTSERSCLIVAEARSDLTTMTTNGHSSRYSEAFSEMQVLCKHPDFVNSLKSELDICLASHQNKPTTKSSSISLPRYDAEDFLVEIVDKIFSPMSQCPEFSVKSNMAPTTSSNVDMRRDGKCEITSEEHCGGVGTKSPETRETSSLKGRLNPGVETPASANALCSILEKRKQMLRDKMAKLLAYDQPAPLHPLPVAGSPACIKEFKSPVNKKT